MRNSERILNIMCKCNIHIKKCQKIFDILLKVLGYKFIFDFYCKLAFVSRTLYLCIVTNDDNQSM